MNDTRNELEVQIAELGVQIAELEWFLTMCGLDKSLAGDIMRKAERISIETGRPMFDILHDYCAGLRMGWAICRPGWR